MILSGGLCEEAWVIGTKKNTRCACSAPGVDVQPKSHTAGIGSTESGQNGVSKSSEDVRRAGLVVNHSPIVPSNLAWRKSIPDFFAPVIFAPDKFALDKFALHKFALDKSALCKFAPDKFAPDKNDYLILPSRHFISFMFYCR